MQQEPNTEQRELPVVFHDFHGKLLPKPVNDTTESFENHLSTVGQAGGYRGRLLQPQLADCRARNNQVTAERRVDPSRQIRWLCNGFGSDMKNYQCPARAVNHAVD